MRDQNNLLQFCFSILCLITVSCCYNTSHAQETKAIAGQVILVSGNAFKAIQPDKKERVLTRRSPVFQGDILETGADTTAQIRFKDDAVILIQANSSLSVDQYTDSTKGDKEDKSFTTLLKGGFRTITGKIAERNPNNYQVKTPVAIIGVRGTNYTALFKTKDLFVSVWQGTVLVQNSGGTITLGGNEKFKSAIVSGPTTMPQGLVSPPREINPSGCP